MLALVNATATRKLKKLTPFGLESVCLANAIVCLVVSSVEGGPPILRWSSERALSVDIRQLEYSLERGMFHKKLLSKLDVNLVSQRCGESDHSVLF